MLENSMQTQENKEVEHWQTAEIEIGIKEAEEGELIEHEAVVAKWKVKLNQQKCRSG